MDWNDLRYLLAAHRAGSLAGAARELKVNHTTVSRRLTALEEALKTQLVVRSGDGLRLTPAGENVIRTAEAVEASCRSLEQSVLGQDEKPAGKVKLTTSDALSDLVMHGFVDLTSRYPQLQVDVVVDNARLDLQRGEADIAIRTFRETQADLMTRKVGEIGWGLFASESYLAKHGGLKDFPLLDGHDIVGFDERLSSKPYIKWLEEGSKNARIVMRGNGPRAVATAVANGLGVSVIPCFLAAGDARLRRVASAVIGTNDIWVACLPEMRKHARIRAVLEHVDELFTRNARLLSGEI